MADSEASTTSPVVSRRRIISTTLATTAVTFLPPTNATEASVNAASDPAMTAWRTWQVAHKKTLALCRKQQRLETKLHRTVGLPHVSVRLPGVREPVQIISLHDLDKMINSHPTAANLRDGLVSELSAHQQRWEEADRLLGYSAALEEEAAAAVCEQHLAENLWSTASSSLAGIAAKLQALIATGQSTEDCEELPWPQLRSALRDLRRLSQTSDVHRRQTTKS
jgi:hypothetical protein